MGSFTAGLQHPQVRLVINLIKNRTPNKQNLFIVEGIWSHKRLLQTELKPESFFYCPEMIFSQEAHCLYHKYSKISKVSIKVSEKVFCKIACRKKPDGLLSVCKFPHFEYSNIKLKSTSLVLILDGLEKPGNIGTLIRSLNGVGGDAVFICNRRARMTHPKIVKSSCGINFSIPIIESTIPDLVKWLFANQFSIYLTTCKNANSFSKENYPKRTAIVLGNERYGISQEWYENKHKKITVPMKGQIDSYNVAVAGSIIMYEIAKSIFSDI